MDRQPPTLYQTVVAEFMQQGHFPGHIRRIRQLYHEQRDALAATLMRRAADHLDVGVRPTRACISSPIFVTGNPTSMSRLLPLALVSSCAP
jgi:DNA-binding transcriptional MocR family regulator